MLAAVLTINIANTAFDKYSTVQRMLGQRITSFIQYVGNNENMAAQASTESPRPAMRRPQEKWAKNSTTEFHSASFKSIAKALYQYCCLGSYGDKRKMQ